MLDDKNMTSLYLIGAKSKLVDRHLRHRRSRRRSYAVAWKLLHTFLSKTVGNLWLCIIFQTSTLLTLTLCLGWRRYFDRLSLWVSQPIQNPKERLLLFLILLATKGMWIQALRWTWAPMISSRFCLAQMHTLGWVCLQNATACSHWLQHPMNIGSSMIENKWNLVHCHQRMPRPSLLPN